MKPQEGAYLPSLFCNIPLFWVEFLFCSFPFVTYRYMGPLQSEVPYSCKMIQTKKPTFDYNFYFSHILPYESYPWSHIIDRSFESLGILLRGKSQTLLCRNSLPFQTIPIPPSAFPLLFFLLLLSLLLISSFLNASGAYFFVLIIRE